MNIRKIIEDYLKGGGMENLNVGKKLLKLTSLNNDKVSYINSSCFEESRHLLHDEINFINCDILI